MAQKSMHKRGSHALVMMFLILTPLWASRSLAMETHIENRTRLDYNQKDSAEVVGLIFMVQGIVSAGYAVHSTYQSYKDMNEEQRKLIDAKTQAKMFERTHNDLCVAVDKFVRSLLNGGRKFEAIAHNPSCDQHDIDFLVNYLDKVSGKPLGNKEDIQEAVNRICTVGFTKTDAMGLKLEETWWMGVAQGLGCKSEPIDDSFLTRVWSESSAKAQSSSMLQKKKLAAELISLGLFVVVAHTDVFSVLGAFEPQASSAKVYEDFAANSIESLKRLSCRLSYPMFLRSLRVEVLERAWLALEFNHAGLTLPRENLDVCKETLAVGTAMVCKTEEMCLIPLAHWGPTSECGLDCFIQIVQDKSRANEIHDWDKGSYCLTHRNSAFYNFCDPFSGGRPSVKGIVHKDCLTWEIWKDNYLKSHLRMKHVAKYGSCETPFDKLKEASELMTNFGGMKQNCGWSSNSAV